MVMLNVEPENKVKNSVTSPGTQAQAQKRFRRRDIAGARGWQIGKNGLVYKHRKQQPTEHEEFPQFPTVDFGKEYKGYLLPASDRKGLILLDEVACLAFHGWPPLPDFLAPYGLQRMGHRLWWSHVIHHDGNPWECHADNIAWEADIALLEHTIENMMWPDHLVKGQWQRGKTRANAGKKSNVESQTHYVSSPHLPGWLPVNNKGKNIA